MENQEPLQPDIEYALNAVYQLTRELVELESNANELAARIHNKRNEVTRAEGGVAALRHAALRLKEVARDRASEETPNGEKM